MKKCATSGKTKYRSKLDCMLENSRLPIIARSYLCAACGFWHLTRRESA